MLKNIKLDEHKICTFKNIADFDFTPELGAMFGGRSYFVKSGEELLAPEPVAWRLAVNLAKAILNKIIPEPEYGKGDDRSSITMVTDEKIQSLVGQIIVNAYAEQKPAVLSEEEKFKQKIEELNKWQQEMESKLKVGFQDKQEVIDELEKREIKFDRRKSKAELEKMLETAN